MIVARIAKVTSRPGLSAVGVMLCLTVAAGCGIIRHRTPARCEAGLPCYDGYGQKATIGRVPGLTFTGIRLIEQPVPEDILARAAAPAVASRQKVTTVTKNNLATTLINPIRDVFNGTEPTPAEPLPPAESTPIPAIGDEGDASETTTTTVVQTNPAVAPKPVRVRYFALADDQLQVDHCRLSQVSVILWSDGRWELFVRAEQNPPEVPEGTPAGTAVAARPQRKQTSHIKRSEFHVVAKGFGVAQAGDPAIGDRVAKPVLLHRSMNPFWVERGQPKELIFDGKLDSTQDFDLIKRFEVEFAYR